MFYIHYSTDCLRPFLQLLSVISEDKKLKDHLERNAKKNSSELQNSQTTAGNTSGSVSESKIIDNVTTEDVPGVRLYRMESYRVIQIKRVVF